MNWDRKLWGVELTTSRVDCAKDKLLLGAAWHDAPRHEQYPGEISRALLFATRREALAWCKQKAGRCNQKHWRFRAVRVRETVRVERGT